MANNKMLIDAGHPEETRVAMVRGNRVDEFDFESEHKTQLRGNIYLAKVTRVEPSLQAAFVDYGGNRHGFLAFSEIHPDYYQIPVADRQALLDAEAEDARLEDEEREAEDEAQEAEQEDAKPARKRRSRRRGKKESTEEQELETSSQTDSEGADQPEDAADATSEESDDSEDEISAENEGDDAVSEPAAGEKPARRRTSRPRKQKVSEETAVAEPEQPVEPAEAVESKPVESPEEKPAPKKRRTTSRKKKTEQADKADNPDLNENAVEPVTSESEAAAPSEEKPKKRRTSRRKKPEQTEEVMAEAAPNETAVEEAQEVSADDTGEAKPKRRRTSRRKKADAEAQSTETKDAQSDTGPMQVEDESEAEASDQTSDQADETSDDAGAKTSTRKRRRGRGRGRKSEQNQDTSKDDEGSSDDVDSVGAEDALEEVPTRRTQRRHYKIQEVIKRRQILLVQVVKEERGNKGAALTTYLSLAGRYSVLMPNTARGGGISRKITNSSDRKRLKAIASDLDVPAGMGVILRTAGASRTQAEVQRDFEYLLRLWENVRTLTLESTAPCLVYEEGSLIKRSIRDLYDKDTGEIIVAGEAGFREAKDFMAMLMPDHAKNVKLYKDRIPMFAKLGVEAQLDAMLQPQVTLKSGGYLVINQTEALVAIDVNSGRSTRQHSIEETATQTNLEAADEVARQLRLRDLAGLIVIDFIDMEDRRNNRAVEKRLKDALKNDRARIQVGRISHFGLMEMSRQRIRASVLESTTQVCPVCDGVGHVRAASSVVLGVLRTIEEQLNKNSRNNLIIKVRSESALYLLNNKREHISDLEMRFGVSLEIEIDNSIGQEQCVIERGSPSNRKPTAEIAVQPDTIAPETDVSEPVGEETNQSADTNNGEESTDKKKRRRRRRKKSDHSEDNASNENVASTTEVSPQADSDAVAEVNATPSSEASDAASSEEEAKPKRTRRRRKKPEDVVDEESANKAGEENAVTASIDEEKPKPKRRSRAKKTVDSEVSEQSSQDDSTENVEADAPKRRTTRRKKSVVTDENSSDETGGSASNDGEENAESGDEAKKEGWWKRKFF